MLGLYFYLCPCLASPNHDCRRYRWHWLFSIQRLACKETEIEGTVVGDSWEFGPVSFFFCVRSQRTDGREVGMPSLTTAVTERVLVTELLLMSEEASRRASGNKTSFTALIICTWFSCIHFRQSLLKVNWLPERFGYFTSFRQSLSVCPVCRHLAQTISLLQAFRPWPNRWHLKHQSRFGTYTATGNRPKWRRNIGEQKIQYGVRPSSWICIISIFCIPDLIEIG